MVVGPFRPAIRTGSAVERVFSSASAEAAPEEAASDEAAASDESGVEAAGPLATGPPQAARLSSRAADSSREASFFMIGNPLLCKIFSKCHKTICFATPILL